MPLLSNLKNLIESKSYDIVKLSDKEYNELKNLIDEFGGGIEEITIDQQNEDRGSFSGKSFPSQNLTDLASDGHIVSLPHNLDSRLYKMIDEGSDLINWYSDITDLVFSNLSESDACLFLLLLASTSAGTALSQNFDEAATFYVAIKKDMKENEKQLLKFSLADINGKNFSYNSPEFEQLYLIRAMREIEGFMYVSAKILNIQKSIKYVLDAGGNLSRRKLVPYMMKHFNPYSSSKKNIYSVGAGTEMIGAAKVFNFAMNLLDPSAFIKKYGKPWYFVTIDSWMVRAIYISGKGKNKYLESDVMSSNTKYLHVAKRIMDVSKKVNMEPHQVQAAIWVARIRRTQTDTYVQSFAKAIERRTRSLQYAGDIADDIENNLNNVISIVAKEKSPVLDDEYSSTDFNFGANKNKDKDEEAPF